MSEGGGDKKSEKAKGKSGKEKLPDPIGQSRDQAGKAVGVSGRMVDALTLRVVRSEGHGRLLSRQGPSEAFLRHSGAREFYDRQTATLKQGDKTPVPEKLPGRDKGDSRDQPARDDAAVAACAGG